MNFGMILKNSNKKNNLFFFFSCLSDVKWTIYKMWCGLLIWHFVFTFRLSLQEFCHLLDSIEERLPARDIELYSSSTDSEQKLREIIRYDSFTALLESSSLHCCAVFIPEIALSCH